MPPIEASAPGSIGKEQPVSRKCSFERLARHAGLDDAIEVFGVNREHAVHARQSMRDAAVQRVDMAFQRSADAERDDRRVMRGADAHGVDDVLRAVGEHHRVGRRVVGPGQRVAMLTAHRLGGDEAVAEARREITGERCDCGGRKAALAAAQTGGEWRGWCVVQRPVLHSRKDRQGGWREQIGALRDRRERICPRLAGATSRKRQRLTKSGGSSCRRANEFADRKGAFADAMPLYQPANINLCPPPSQPTRRLTNRGARDSLV